MSTSTNRSGFLDRIAGFLTFKGSTIKEVTESSNASKQALYLIFLNIVVIGILRTFTYYQTQDFSLLGFGSFAFGYQTFVRSNTILLNGLFSSILSAFIFTFFIAFIMGISGKYFGGNTNTMESIRIIGFSTPILIIGTVLIYGIAIFNIPGIGWFYFVFLFWYFIIFFVAFQIGSDFDYKKTFASLIATIAIAIVILEFLLIFLGSFYIQNYWYSLW